MFWHKKTGLCGFLESRNTGRLKLLILRACYSIERIVYSLTPPGVETMTSSPALRPSSALPTGDSLEIRPADGLASKAPTSVYLYSRSSLVHRWTTEPRETTSVRP